MPAAGGAARLRVRFDAAERPSQRPEFVTDGERLYFTMAQQEGDVWEMALEREESRTPARPYAPGRAAESR